MSEQETNPNVPRQYYRPYQPFEPTIPKVSSKCCLSEEKARASVLVVAILATFAYLGYQIYKAVDAAQNPVTKFNSDKVTSVACPGVLICVPDTLDFNYQGFFAVNHTSCGLRDREGNTVVCDLSMVNYTFTYLLPGERQCIDLKPGQIFHSKQSIVNIEWLYIIPDIPLSYERVNVGFYRWDAAFYGFYTDDQDRATAAPRIASITGSTLVTFTHQTSTAVDKTVTRSVEIDSVSTAGGSRPIATGNNVSLIGLPEYNFGYTWHAGSLIIMPNDMVEKTVVETVAWGPFDVISALGGFSAIITSFLLTMQGEDYFRNPGLLRKLFYGVYLPDPNGRPATLSTIQKQTNSHTGLNINQVESSSNTL